MSTHADHLRLFRQGDFPVPLFVQGLTEMERQLLVDHGYWLVALASGTLTPETPSQERFVAVAHGLAAPVNQYEKAFVKLRPPKSARDTELSAPRSPENDALLRQLRGMLGRHEVISSFADGILRQWQETSRLTPSQIAAVRRLLARAAERKAEPRFVGGGGRKPGSHRSNW